MLLYYLLLYYYYAKLYQLYYFYVLHCQSKILNFIYFIFYHLVGGGRIPRRQRRSQNTLQYNMYLKSLFGRTSATPSLKALKQTFSLLPGKYRRHPALGKYGGALQPFCIFYVWGLECTSVYIACRTATKHKLI